ncbi:MAG: hypothetical protein MK033_11085 [Candidatus Caenarcaniphilales bacterium]|nr:hypothetical protein [Candidatus Caenarcaniphilales bacterium]
MTIFEIIDLVDFEPNTLSDLVYNALDLIIDHQKNMDTNTTDKGVILRNYHDTKKNSHFLKAGLKYLSESNNIEDIENFLKLSEKITLSKSKITGAVSYETKKGLNNILETKVKEYPNFFTKNNQENLSKIHRLISILNN